MHPPPTADEAPTPSAPLEDLPQIGLNLADLLLLTAALLALETVLIGWNRSRRRAGSSRAPVRRWVSSMQAARAVGAESVVVAKT